MKASLQLLEKLGACSPAIEWFKQNNTGNPIEMINLALQEDHFSWIVWLFVRYMNKKQNVEFAIYCAELVLPIYEEKYPDDDRPRKAIEAARAYLKRPSKRTKRNANTAAYAADAAAYADAAAAAADAAAAAADAAAAAAAAYADADAADAADAAYADAAVYADAAAYAAAEKRKEVQRQIIDKGIEILKIKD